MPKRKVVRRKKRVITSWKKARTVLESWRKKGASVQVELRRPRLIDVVPIDFLRGEPIHDSTDPRAGAAGQMAQKFRGQVIYFTGDDVTVRRPSGAILLIDIYEIAVLSDGKTRIEPQ